MSRLSRNRPVALVCLAVLVVALVTAVVFIATDHPKRGAAFIGVAVVAALGAVWFLLAPKSDT